MKYEDTLLPVQARRRYYKRLRAMPGPDKLRIMSAMHAQARRLLKASIRNRFPQLSSSQIETEVRRRLKEWNK